MDRKRDSTQERKLADSLYNRRGKLRLKAKPVGAHVGSGGSVFSVRFSDDELERLRERASAQGTTISGLIRGTVLRNNVPPQIVMTSPDAVMIAANSATYLTAAHTMIYTEPIVVNDAAYQSIMEACVEANKVLNWEPAPPTGLVTGEPVKRAAA